MKRPIIHGMALVLVSLVVVFSMSSGWAETSENPGGNSTVPPEISQEMAREPAIVMIHNRPIVIFYAPMFGHTLEQRMKLAEERIKRVLAGKDLGKVTTREIALGTIISIGNSDVLLITPEDANPAYGQTRKEILDRAVTNLTLAVKEVKECAAPVTSWRPPLTPSWRPSFMRQYCGVWADLRSGRKSG